MQIQDLEALFSRFNEDDMWGSVIDDCPELYLEKGQSFTVRIVGPVYKAQRCFISRNNSVVRSISFSQFRKVLSGNPIEVNRSVYPAKCVNEIDSASCKAQWNKCLVCTVVLISSSGPSAFKNKLNYLSLPHTAVAQLLQIAKARPNLCLSGVKANDITIRRERSAFSESTTSVSSKESLLNKEALEYLLSEGLRDAKEYYIKLNQKNLVKKSGFFYSFMSENESSTLDKHLEPITQIKNYIEEDKQIEFIEEDPQLIAEYEGVGLMNFVDVL